VFELFLIARDLLLGLGDGREGWDYYTGMAFDEHMPEPLKVLGSPLDFPADADGAVFIPGDGLNGEEEEGIPDELVDKGVAVILNLGHTTFLI
jgi:hypothetical protein